MAPSFPSTAGEGRKEAPTSLMRNNCSILAGTRGENSHGHTPLPRTPYFQQTAEKSLSVSLGGTCRKEIEARGTRKALGGKTRGDGVPGEMLAHPCPPLSHVWTPRVREEKKGPRAASVTTGARWPLQGDGLVLKPPKTPAKSALGQRDPGKEPFRSCTEHSFGPKLRDVMWGPSPPVQPPPCLFPPLSQHPHPAVTAPWGCTSTPAASRCSWVQDRVRGIWECCSTHCHPNPQPALPPPSS